MDERGLPEDDETIRPDHDDVLVRLEAFGRGSSTTEELVDLTILEPRADLIVLPEADDHTAES